MTPRGRVALIGAVLIAAAQLVPVPRTNPPVRSQPDAPEHVLGILRRACYDCHSNETRWPWYSRVAPTSWVVASHVRRARGDLNFSEWPTFDFELQELSRDDIREQIANGRMPLRSYTFIHRGARLDAEDREALLAWARSTGARR